MGLKTPLQEKNVFVTRGQGFKKEIWISFCSRHMFFNNECDICKSGIWKNYFKYKFSSWFYDVSPTIWRWWVNK